eukprot:m.50227 g.50227  ORF g.50227 m.50227 type:complete len:267 (+) comp7216_c0_seq3:205-1005(+)
MTEINQRQARAGVNVRDAASAAPALVRPGRLFRASEIFDIPGIRTVLDLRGGGDRHAGENPVDESGVHRHHIKFITRTAAARILWDVGPSTLVPVALFRPRHESFKVAMGKRVFKDVGCRQLYTIFVTSCQSEIRATLLPLADPGAFPVVVHCIHGKDRTGIVMALVLAILGASRDEILTDYALSREEILQGQSAGLIPEDNAALRVDPEFITSDPADLRDSLFAHLDTHHHAPALKQSARSYLEAECQLTSSELDRVVANLALST